jgi:hypothetical protein
MGQHIKNSWLEKNYKFSKILATLKGVSESRTATPLGSDSVINKSRTSMDARRNIIETHDEEELCSCELKRISTAMCRGCA